jgi:hypothetical protein
VVHAYLEMAGTAFHGKQSIFKRVRPLIALPMPGVGLMDAKQLLNDDTLFKWILPVLYKAVDTYGIDVALCTTSQRAFDVMQVRPEHPSESPLWDVLSSCDTTGALEGSALGLTLLCTCA